MGIFFMFIFDNIYCMLRTEAINYLNLRGLQIVSGKGKTSAHKEYKIIKGPFISADILLW